MGRGGREGADGLVDNVFGLEDVVDYALAVGFLARALIDDPIAVDDKLCSVLAGSAHLSRS
jgi:hypothetical protein